MLMYKKDRLSLILVSFLFFQGLLFAQEWVKMEPRFSEPGSYNMGVGTFVTADVGYFVDKERGVVFKTTDGGNNWDKIKTGFPQDTLYATDIYFSDEKSGVIFGGPGSSTGNGFVWKTDDGGVSWNEYETPILGHVFFLNSLIGFGGSRDLYSTKDGGLTWEKAFSEEIDLFTLEDIFFVNDSVGCVSFLYREDGELYNALLKTVDCGKTWEKIPSPACLKIHFSSYNKGLGGIFLKEIYKTNDGITWDTVQTNAYYGHGFIFDIEFQNANEVWVVGSHGTIAKSKDGGLTWEGISTNFSNALFRIEFVNDKLGYIFGEDNCLLKLDNTVDIKDDKNLSVPLNFNLGQNYPNPFNPTTIINYTLSENSFVIIKVYDILGNEISTLVNDTKPAGNYSLEFNKADLPSGIYLYSMRAKAYSRTRKMILLK